jgi:hypothetical protein
VPGFQYCTEPGLNFSTTATYSEDDADFAPGRRGKASRVSAFFIFIISIYLYQNGNKHSHLKMTNFSFPMGSTVSYVFATGDTYLTAL